MNKTKFAIVTGAVFILGAASVSYAAEETTTTKAPLEQAEKSVGDNLAKDTDNKGLQTAAKHIEANETRIAEKRAEMAEKHSVDRSERAERPERTERPEVAERPESAGRR